MTNTATNPDKSPKETFDELRTLVTDYAKQETTGPLKSLGQWVGYGLAGGVMVSTGIVFVALAALRFFQTEVSWWNEREHTFALSYVMAIVVLAVGLGLAVRAMMKSDD